jgi:hypothetical protein
MKKLDGIDLLARYGARWTVQLIPNPHMPPDGYAAGGIADREKVNQVSGKAMPIRAA